MVGASMGGAISQIIAVKSPSARVSRPSLTAGRNHPWRGRSSPAELARRWRSSVGSARWARRRTLGDRHRDRSDASTGDRRPRACSPSGDRHTCSPAQCDAVPSPPVRPTRTTASADDRRRRPGGRSATRTPDTVGDSERPGRHLSRPQNWSRSAVPRTGSWSNTPPPSTGCSSQFLGRAERAYQGRRAEQDELDTALALALRRYNLQMRVVIVGAGICGLVAGRRLADSDVDVVLLDKGRSVGGRLATRRIGDATVDHGAQFFTVRTPAFQRQVDDWVDRGLATVWSHGFSTSDGHPRYVATSGMNSLAKDLATGLDVRCSSMAFGIRAGSDAIAPWQVAIDDGTVHDADAVIVTTPLPRPTPCLPTGDRLRRVAVDRLRPHDRAAGHARSPGGYLAPGGVQSPTPDIGFVVDNQAKGVSATPAITVHASPSWSEAHWDDDIDTLRPALIELADTWLGGAVVIEAQVKKWRFATPRSPWPDPVLDRRGRVDRAGGRRVRRATGGSRGQLGPGGRPCAQRLRHRLGVSRRRARRSARW